MAVEQLHQALQALYHHTDSHVKDQGARWLEQWQQSVEAWNVSDSILHDSTSNMEAQYFCAQTLRTKVGIGRTPLAHVQNMHYTMLVGSAHAQI